MDSQIQVLEGLGNMNAIEEVNISGLGALAGTYPGVGAFDVGAFYTAHKSKILVAGALVAAVGAFTLYKKGKLPFFKKSPAAALYGLQLAGFGGTRSRRRRKSRR